MLTRNDRTIDDAMSVVDTAADLGVRHIGFKDVGITRSAMRDLAGAIRARGAVCYLEVVSTSTAAVEASLEAGRALGVDRLLGGTDLDAAQRILGGLSGYLPFAGRPIGHPTRLEGSAALVAAHAHDARARGCAGVDLLAYRATQADPLDLVRAARRAMPDGRLVVAGSIHTPQQIDSLAAAGADAFTVGSAVFDGTFAPGKESLHGQLAAILDACAATSRAGG